MDIIEICRRYFSGESINSISKQSGVDRKTIRKYLNKVKSHGIESYDKENLLLLSEEIISKQYGRPKKSQEKLNEYLEEIRELLKNDLKLKTIHEILIERHEIELSYSTFKRFARSNQIKIGKAQTTCRLDKEPGLELQVDYAKMGMLYDPITKKRRTTYAFIGTLSSSRHKFVEFVYSQNQQSFVQSHVKMFNYFGAVPKIIIIDNLKSGVIKPDLYDPKLNRAYAEMAEYYECFINPARVATPKDKPIVERDVQTVREQFKKNKALNEHIRIDEANRKITDWLISKYGQTDHGTTGLKPYEEFTNMEKEKMLPLPIAPFEAALWKEAAVHPDHFIQVNKKSYSIPHQYVGKKVWAKVTAKMVYVYYDEKLIKQHSIPNGYRQTDLNDFPENMQGAIRIGMPGYLLNQAKNISEELGKLVTKILTPHAYTNMRSAQGIIRIAQKLDSDIIDRVSAIAMENHNRITPKIFTRIIEDFNAADEIELDLPLSEETSSFIRNTDYFIHNN
ncbi:MAG: IS21 family transposase [Bacteroidetes bacterium]|nr:IS21 family transposase [Bacteroidota bacterium]